MKRFSSIFADKPENLIYLFLLSLYTYAAILDDSLLNLTTLIRALRWCIIIVGIFLFFYRHKGIPPVKNLVFAATVLIVFYIASKATGRTYLVLYAVLIIMAEGCDPDKTVKVWLLSTVLALLTILTLCWIGVLTDHIIYRADTGKAAHCLGFSYFSYFPDLVLFCSIAYIYLKKNNVTVFHYILVGLINLLTYYVTRLNLTFYVTFIFIALDCLLMKVKKLDLGRKPVMVVSSMLFPLGAVVTFLAMVYYNPENVRCVAMDRLSHNRLGLMHLGYQRYPISLFGNRLKMVGHSALRTVAPVDYFYIDSGFAYSLLGYGMFFTVVALALYSILYLYSSRTNNKHLFAWLSCVLIFTMMNNVWVDVYYNPALLLAFAAYTGLSEWEGRWRPILITAEIAGLAAAAVWLVPWFKTLGDAAVGGSSRLALLAAVLLLLLLLGLAFSLGSLMLKLLQHQKPGKRQLAWAGVLLVCCSCGILSVNRQLNRLTAQNIEKLESERLAVETVQQAEDCRLLVDGPEEVYRRAFGGVAHTLYHGDNLTAESNVAYITGVENNYQELIRKGYLYTEISEEHALYTNSADAAAALQAAGYHLTGYYSHDCAVGTENTEAPRLPVSAYRATYDLRYVQLDGVPAPAPDTAVATLTVKAKSAEAPLAARDVLYSEFGVDGTCSAFLDFSIGSADSVEFLTEDRTGAGDVLVNEIHYCQYPAYDTHFTCDVSGRRISEAYYDLSGNPITIQDGSHAREYGYEKNGNVTITRYLDLNNNPVIIVDGYAEIHREFNKMQQIINEEYLNTDGTPINIGLGYSGLWNEYDAQDQLSLTYYHDVDGNLVACGSWNFHEYLIGLSERKDATIFLSIRDEGTNALTGTIIEDLKSLGLCTDLRGKYRNSYYAVISPEGIAEELSVDRAVSQSGSAGGVEYSITSAGFETGNISSIKINGTEYSKNGRGMNIVVVENGSVVDSVAFDTYARDMKMTR